MGELVPLRVGQAQTDLVRFQWRAGTYSWSSRPPPFYRRKITEVESSVNRTYGTVGPFDLSTATLQGYCTSGGRFFRLTGGRDRTEPAKITEYSWRTGLKVATHNEPRDADFPAMPWEPEGCAAIKQGTTIKTLFGIVRSNRKYLIYSFP